MNKLTLIPVLLIATNVFANPMPRCLGEAAAAATKAAQKKTRNSDFISVDNVLIENVPGRRVIWNIELQDKRTGKTYVYSVETKPTAGRCQVKSVEQVQRAD